MFSLFTSRPNARSFESSVKLFDNCRTLIALTLVFFIFTGVAHADTDAETRVAAEIIQSWGKLISPEQLPETSASLLKSFQSLATAQEARLKLPAGTNRLFIFDSDQVNALVAPGHVGSNQHYFVYVSRALLTEVLPPDLDPLAVPERLEEVAGILAHELAHPIDMLDPNGIEAKQGPYNHSQAIEIRTDTEALDLLRAAGFAEDSLYRGLKRILALPRPLLVAFFSTHPEKDLRLSVQRSLLTERRLRIGHDAQAVKIQVATSRRILSEVSLFSRPRNANSIELPTSLGDFVGKYNPALSSDLRSVYLLWLDNFLENQNTFSEHEEELLSKIREEMKYPHSSSLCQNRECLERVLRGVKGAESLKVIPHRDYLQFIPFFNRPPTYKYEGTSFNLDLYSRVAIQAYLPQTRSWEFHEFFSKTVETSLLESRSTDDLLSWAEYLIGQTSMLTDAVSDKATANFGLKFLLPTATSRQLWNSLLSRSTSQEKRERATKVLQQIWATRGYWAYTEFLARSVVDWELVARVAGIPQTQVKIEVRRAFLATLKSNAARWRELEDLNYRNLKARSGPKPMWMSTKIESSVMDAVRGAGSYEPLTRLQFHLEDSSLLHEKYQRIFKRAISQRRPKSVSDLDAVVLEAVRDLEPQAFNRLTSHLDRQWRIALEVIGSSNLSSELKAEYLDAFLLRKTKLAFRDTDNSPEQWHQLLSVFQKLQPGLKGDELFRRMAATTSDSYLEVHRLRGVALSFRSDIETSFLINGRLPTPVEILEQLKRDVDSYAKLGKQNEYEGSKTLGDIYLSSTGLQKAKLGIRYQAYIEITRIVSNTQTDTFFREQLLPELLKQKSARALRFILKANTISSESLRAELAREVLQPNLESRDIEPLSKEIDSYLPSNSNWKDKLIEEISWTKNLSGEELRTFTDAHKLANWRAANAGLVNAGSAMSEQIKKLSKDARSALVQWIGNGAKDALPNIVRKELRAQERIGKSAADQSQSETTIRNAEDNIITTIRNASPMQRVPLVELILTNGSNSLISRPEDLESMSRLYAKTEKGSIEDAMLVAYLDVIPEHERSVTLAYIIAHSSQSDGASLKTLLEVFGTIGIKFGQMAAAWDLLGPEKSRELEDLFDRASPMTKIEVEAQALRALGKQNYESHIAKFTKLLGSASVKTVVLTSLRSGKNVALMLKRDGVEGQIKTNLNLSERFVTRLEKEPLIGTNPLLRAMIKALRAQIFDEINLRTEARNYRTIRAVVAELNSRGSWRKSGWSVETPNEVSEIPETESAYALEAVEGVSAKEFFADVQVASGEKAVVGRVLTDISLSMLFQHGIFDPDRHPGNWLIDRNSKKIYFIDPGQLISFTASRSPFKWDPRLTLAGFLRSLDAMDAHGLAHYAGAMTVSGQMSPSVELVLTQKIDRVLKGSSALTRTDLLKNVVQQIYDQDLDINPLFTFGSLKGLMMLSGSQYVSEVEFREILRSEIRGLTVRKSPVVVGDSLRKLIRYWWPVKSGSSCVEAFSPN